MRSGENEPITLYWLCDISTCFSLNLTDFLDIKCHLGVIINITKIKTFLLLIYLEG